MIFDWLISARLEELSSIYDYQGEQTCAADGMCQVKCPVKINTGEMVKTLRAERYDEGGSKRPARVAMVSLVIFCSVPAAVLLDRIRRCMQSLVWA